MFRRCFSEIAAHPGRRAHPTHAGLASPSFSAHGRSAGIELRLWTRPVVERGRAVPMTLTWRFGDGTPGKRGCGGMLETTEYASRVVAMARAGERLKE